MANPLLTGLLLKTYPIGSGGAADLSGFTITDPGTQTTGEAFNLGITGATDTDGDDLAGAIAVTVVSGDDGTVYSDSPTFTAGAATLTGITLTTVDTQTLTVTIAGVTNSEQIMVVVEAAAMTASEFLASLNPDGYWKLGEASGDALDSSGNGNDGTVTLGGGTRATAALDDQGDGSLTTAANTSVSVAAAAAINNIWDGGGCVFLLFNPDVHGSNALVGKSSSFTGSGWGVIRTASPLVALDIEWTTTNGQWGVIASSGQFMTDDTNFAAVLYDSTSADNDPTIILWNQTNGTTIATVGDGLSEFSAPAGTRVSDVSIALGMNHVNGAVNILDEVAVWSSSSPPSQQDIIDYIALVPGS